jgi:DNA-binding transcriptional MerR regulator
MLTPRPVLKRYYYIAELQRLFDITARALRFYEEKGLLSPIRKGTSRIYTRRDYHRLEVIVRARKVNLGLGEIEELLELYDPADGGRAQLAKALERMHDRAARLDAERAAVDAAIAELSGDLKQVEGRGGERLTRSVPRGVGGRMTLSS